MDDLDEIVHEFLVESHENLDQLDSDLVALESSPDSRDLLSSIFRTIHTIKGTSGFLAFSILEKVTHAGENLLVELRDGRRTMDVPTADALLAMVDSVRAILGAIEKDGTEGGLDVAPVLAQIATVMEGRAAEGAAPAAEPAAKPAAEPAAKPATAPAAPAEPAPADAEPEPAPAAPVAEIPTQRAEASDVPAAPAAAPPAAAPAAPAASEGTSRTLSDSSVRVDVDLLDAIMRQVGELVLARGAIGRLATDRADLDLQRASQRLSLIASELQEGVMKTRMQPIEHAWNKAPRMVRDLSAGLGRQVKLEMVGGDTELDRSLLEAIGDPLTHLIRNAIDHGIEAPDVRVAAGKPAQGRLLLRAYHSGGQVVVEAKDDGKGIDPAVVAAKAVSRGLRTPEQVALMSPNELLHLLFLPGFSTAEAVTNVSGRGVGMDVVRTKIEGIGGTVDVDSVLGAGTTWRLRIPLTLAIMPALTVVCDAQHYAIPQVSLLELVALPGGMSDPGVEHVRSAAVYRLRGELLPLVDLREVLGSPTRGADEASMSSVIAVLQTDRGRFGLVVDQVLNTEEIVVKPLASQLKQIGLYAGATLLGDGRVTLILDVQAIARRSMQSESQEQVRGSRDEDVVTREAVQMLVTGIGAERRLAIPLEAVTRIERIPADAVERLVDRDVLQYRGMIMPLIRLGRVLGAEESEREELIAVVYTRGERSVAMVVDEIVDIVDDLDVEGRTDLGGYCLLGSTVLKGRVTEILDVRTAIRTVDENFFAGAADGDPADLAATAAADAGDLVGV